MNRSQVRPAAEYPQRVLICPYTRGMTEPSDYELMAWRDLQRFRGRPVTRLFESAGDHVTAGVAKVGKRATQYLERHPGAQSTVSQGQELVARSARALGVGKQRFSDVLPVWTHAAVGSVNHLGAQIARIGLAPKGVVKKHIKNGHDVASLYDVRRLDLQ